MLRYTFTNDLRSSNLLERLHEISYLVKAEAVPTASEDKSLNNYANTLIFYFNLYKNSNNVNLSLRGQADSVVLNFISKFQFPNPRTKASFNHSVLDKIRLKPYQEILRLLYLGGFSNENFHLTIDEIFHFVFLNPNVAKQGKVDYILLLTDLEEYRENKILPSYIVQNDTDWDWKHSDRQIKELLNILNITKLIKFDGAKAFVENENLDKKYKSVLFDILTNDEFLEVNHLEYEEFKEAYKKYMEIECVTSNFFEFETGLETKFERNRIIFGAPGTGKSYLVNNEKEKLIKNGGVYERVTFYPDYSYSHFVGTYKPVTVQDKSGKDIINYEYVPGPFMRIFTKALKNSTSNNVYPHLLIIEEINRANAAAVFGEVFQLLDRNKNHISEYSIEPTEDIKKYLSKELDIEIEEVPSLKIPDNLFVWSTMNSADQGVFPLDTAFKRRWDFQYIETDNGDELISNKFVILGEGSYARKVKWNELRKEINDVLSTELKINEDKLLGTFFISKHIILPESGDEINSDIFSRVFKHKVLMYLFEDAAKQKTKSLFKGCKDTTRYSYICSEFDERGIEIFGEVLSSKFPKLSDGGQSQGDDEDSSEESE